MKRNRRKGIQNFADAVFRMEASRDKGEVFAVIRELAEMLRAPELKSLRRAFNVWTKGLLKRQTRDSKIVEKIDGLTLLWKP